MTRVNVSRCNNSQNVSLFQLLYLLYAIARKDVKRTGRVSCKSKGQKIQLYFFFFFPQIGKRGTWNGVLSKPNVFKIFFNH